MSTTRCLAAVAAALCPLIAASVAHADVAAVAPADGASVTMSATTGSSYRVAAVQFRAAKAGSASVVGPRLALSRSQTIGSDGILLSDPLIYTGGLMTGGAEPGVYTATVSLDDAGTYYWQAIDTVCNTTTYQCSSVPTPIRTLTVIDPPRVIAAPELEQPSDDAAIDAGEPMEFGVTDPRATGVVVEGPRRRRRGGGQARRPQGHGHLLGRMDAAQAGQVHLAGAPHRLLEAG